MAKILIRTALAMLASFFIAGVSSTVRAALSIDQLYSNADGTIQFVVLSRTGDPLPSLAGRTLVASDGTTSRQYTFPSDSSGDRFHPAVLMATQRFADLARVTPDSGLPSVPPDYIVPDGFLFLANAAVTLGDAVFDYRGRKLPTDGWHALYRDPRSGLGSSYVAAAGNSRGGVLPFGRDPTLSGLWWNAAEPGWGLAVEQQRGGPSTAGFFTVWATHGGDGAPTWFFASDFPVAPPCDPDEIFACPPVIAGRWAGTLYQTTGPPFSTPFDSSRVVATAVGSLDLQFPVNDQTIGDFAFQIGGVGGHRTMTRAIFGDPARQCFFTSGIVSDASNHQGLWWNPSESGWALQVNHQDDVVFALWFTYDEAGKATWLSFTAQKGAAGTYGGTLYRTSGPPFSMEPAASPALSVAVGSATLAFADDGRGTFAYDVNGVSRTSAIERQRLSEEAPICD
jgi:hypothetical protein